MSTAELASEATVINLARECLYRFLAAALTDPLAESWRLVLDPENQRLARDAADLLRQESLDGRVTLGFGELPPDDLDLAPPLAELGQRGADFCGEYDRVFGLVPARECPPYETEYHSSSEAFFRSQQLADIAGFYRAFGLEPARAMPERPDHVVLELEFMAFLLLKKRLALTAAENGDTLLRTTPQAAGQKAKCPHFQLGFEEGVRTCEEAERTFFREHLAWWAPSFATGLRHKAGQGFYADLARVLAAFVPTERARLDAPVPILPVQPASIERPEEQSGCAACPIRT